MTIPHAPGPAYLGVERSILGRPWRARLDKSGEALAQTLTQAHGVDDLTARILAGRGVDVAAAAQYLDPTLRELMPDPSSLQDMDAAVARLAQAIEWGEKIAVFGDYDVDGACSGAGRDGVHQSRRRSSRDSATSVRNTTPAAQSPP